jgi:predicted alpha/beta hydrolase
LLASDPELLSLTLPDGSALQFGLYPADGGDRTPVVVWLPAMGVEARFYHPLARALQARGVNVVTADLRGIGTSTVRASRHSDFGYRELVDVDAAGLLAAARERFPGHPLFLGGHSIGAHVWALRLGRDAPAASPPVRGFIFIAAGTSYYRMWPFPGSVALLGMSAVFQGLSGMLGYFPGHRLGFGGREARQVMRDWAYLTRTGRFRLGPAPLDTDALLARVSQPGLVISFSDDRMAPATAVRHLTAKMPRAAVTHWLLGPEELGATQLGHFRWVRAAGPLSARIKIWLDGNGG